MGRISDGPNNEYFKGVGVLLKHQQDSTIRYGAISDEKGIFLFDEVFDGIYTFETQYVGYVSQKLKVIVRGFDKDLGTIILKVNVKELGSVKIETEIRTRQKGDTTEFSAKEFKMNPDATAEDMVTKLPGITKENGTIRAQGEELKRVTVDGQDFFGEDAALALKNLPAEVIEKIQVFNRKSDKSQFTGLNDGNTEKTMNIITKSGFKNGIFGKVYGGSGFENRNNAGTDFNIFKGNRKLTITGLSSNINQHNVIDRAQSFGINYNDKLGEKWTTSGSYYFHNAYNSNNSNSERQYILSDNQGQLYKENRQSESNNFNHRFNLRIEFKPDSLNSFMITPNLSFQNNESHSLLSGQTTLENQGILSNLLNENKADNKRSNFSSNLLYRHKFHADRRTISISFNANINDNTGNASLLSESVNSMGIDSLYTIDQLTNTISDGNSYSASISYTEPFGSKGILMFNYNPSISNGSSDKKSNMSDSNGMYTEVIKDLSSEFENSIQNQNIGLTYQIGENKYSLTLGLNYQHLELRGKQLFPDTFKVYKPFDNILPNAMFQYTFSKARNISFSYSSNTNVPSINQLQSVIDNTNPQFLSIGNPNLKQAYSHNFVIRFGKTNTVNLRSFFAFINGVHTTNFISNTVMIADSNIFLADGVELKRGSQLAKPANLNGYRTLRSFVTYGLPIKKISSNLNLNMGFNYSQIPALLNQVSNFANNFNFNGGMVLSSNISDRIDFTVAYTGGYNVVKNSIQPLLDNNYIFQSTRAKINWMPWKGLVLFSEISYSQYGGLANSFNKGIVLLNAGLGYKFLKNQLAEIRLSGNDLLKKNNSIARTVTETYIEDKQAQVIQRYFLITFTYNIRKFGVQRTNSNPPNNK